MTKRVAKLTKRIVDAVEAGTTRYVVWDAELKGFGLRVETSGTKTYLVRYRPKGGGSAAPKRFMTLGRHGPLTPEQARTRALGLLGAVAAGSDPAAAKEVTSEALSLADGVKLFLSEHVATKRKARTAEYYRWLLNRAVVPRFSLLKAEDVSRAHFMKLHSELQNTPYQANRVLAVVGSLYSYLAKAGHVPKGTNPTRGIERYREDGRERYLTADELRRLGAALREAETVGLPWIVEPAKAVSKHLAKPQNRRTFLDPGAAAAIRLLTLTGARLREILHLRWEEIDLERGLAFLPDSKTGRKTLVLSSAALAVLSNLPRSSRYVVPGAKLNSPRSDLKKPWAAVQRRAKLEGVRLHDLRHTFASIGAGASLGLPIVGKLLGHTQPQTTARYAHLDADPLRRAANIISDQLAASLEGSGKPPV